MGGACSTFGRQKKCVRGAVKRPERKREFGRPRLKWEDNIEINLKELGLGRGLIYSGSGYRQIAGICECGNEPSGSILCGVFLD